MFKGSYNTKKVTPQAMKVLVKNGLLIGTGGDVTDLLLAISVNEQKFHEVTEVVFAEDFSKVKHEDVDLIEVSKGIRSFLVGYLNPLLN